MAENSDRMSLASTTLQNYPGAKGGSGVAERIISLMPAHQTYVELFCGSAAIFRKKAPSTAAMLVDIDPKVIEALDRCDGCGTMLKDCGPALWATQRTCCPDCSHSNAIVILGDAASPNLWPVSLKAALQDPKTLVYCDPPYLSTPTVNGNRYPFRFDRLQDHQRLIGVLRQLPCRVMLSGYASPLYNDLLRDWRCVAFTAGTRGGGRIECVWLNYPEGLPLHDTRFVGNNRRDRERIKRKKARWEAKFRTMEPAERQVLLEALQAVMQ